MTGWGWISTAPTKQPDVSGGPVLLLTPGEFAESVSLVYFVEKGEVKVIYSLCIFLIFKFDGSSSSFCSGKKFILGPLHKVPNKPPKTYGSK